MFDLPHGTAEALETLFPGAVSRQVDLARLSQWRIGGPADLLVQPRSAADLSRLIGWLSDQGLPYVVIGATTNLLFPDEGLRAICIRIGPEMAGIRVDGDRLHCGAGTWVPFVARAAMQAGLTGIEHVCGIPGTIGGLVCMNGGSQRRGIGEAVVSVQSVGPDGGRHDRGVADCDFRYRHSAFQASGEIVTSVELRLARGRDRGEIRREMLQIMASRRGKFPMELPNCGSVFISNPAFYAEYGPPGAVIERMGFKGVSVGDAQVSTLHANFIVNRGRARAQDVLALIRRIREQVAEKTGYLMEAEARYVFPDGRILSAGEVS